MPCYHPLRAYRPDPTSVDRRLVFSSLERSDLEPLKVPCNQCIGCRLERSRQWAIRCVHEASLYKQNCFITLTFDNEHLPASGSLDKRDFQLFMKKLRKRFGSGVRYFHCGEYGEKNMRPHYHACLFNFDFPDKYLDPKIQKPGGFPLYRSHELEKLWGLGFATVGEVNFETAAYVARYVTKKFSNPDPEKVKAHYELLNKKTGEITDLLPEYTTMSRRPGIGRAWLEKYTGDIYPADRVVIKRKGEYIETRPPRYYDNIFQLDQPEIFEDIQFKRHRSAREHSGETTPERLAVREQIQLSKLQLLTRRYENGK